MVLGKSVVHWVVEFIRREGFVFDAADLEEEMGIDEVLGHYGFCLEVDDEDRKALARELMPLACEVQWREVERMVSLEGW